MMSKNYILDTHCLIWFQEDNPKIPSMVMAEIQDPANTVFFSQVSLFEITIKQKIGKLPEFTADISEVYHQAINDNFSYLTIKNQHLFSYHKIPLLETHRDPFDRLLLATAYEENAIMVSADNNFSLYAGLIQVFW
ncbi:type II toxin-antitoxin system VapC family toxin [Methyloglobulus sp.]|uniref:type II toxin-antitoxin system VapC family toxin n=1 Tax=Methyloglobulus sp. TaxID=2518622 RepID=UPI0039895FF9